MKIRVVLYSAVIILIAIVASHIIIELIDFVSSSSIKISPVLSATAGETISINLPRVKKYDRIYLVLDAYINIDEIYVSPIEVIQLPNKVESFEHDVFPELINEKRYLFIVSDDSERALIHLRLQPLIPYIVKNIEGHQRYIILDGCNGEVDLICISLSPVRFHINNYTRIMFIHPYKQRIEPNFKINGLVKLIHGKVDYIDVTIMTKKEWYTFKIIDPFTPPRVPIPFEIDAYSNDILGRRGEFLGENIEAIGISVGISKGTYEEYSYSIVGIGELVIHNGNSRYEIKPTVQSKYVFNPTVYIFRKFQPSKNYFVSTISLTILFISLTKLTIQIFKGNLS